MPAAHPIIPNHPIDPGWLARHDEAVIAPDTPIIDAHHHLGDRPGWRYMVEDLATDLASGHNVVSTVYLECGARYRSTGDALLAPLGETEFVMAEIARPPAGHARLCEGMVMAADLQAGDGVQAVLDGHREIAGPRLKGIRHSGVWHPRAVYHSPPRRAPGPEMFARSDFRAGLHRLQGSGLVFETWIFHTQLGALADLARAFPDLVIVLDHIGHPTGEAGFGHGLVAALRDWRAALAPVAACPNVRLKIGGMGMRTMGFDLRSGPAPRSSAELAAIWAPSVTTALEAFGPERCMFESNFPVDKGACSYKVLWNAFKRLAAGLSRDEQADLFRRTAARTYGLAEPD